MFSNRGVQGLCKSLTASKRSFLQSPYLSTCMHTQQQPSSSRDDEGDDLLDISNVETTITPSFQLNQLSQRRRSSSVPNMQLVDGGTAGTLLRARSSRRMHGGKPSTGRRRIGVRNLALMFCIEDYQHSETVYSTWSFLYAMLIMVLGVAFPIAEMFGTDVELQVGSFEGFYVYLFVVSSIFIVYVQFFIVQSRETLYAKLYRFLARLWLTCKHLKRKQTDESLATVDCKGNTGPSGVRIGRQMSSFDSHAHTGSFYLRLGAIGFGVGGMVLDGLVLGQHIIEHSSEVDSLKMIRPAMQLVFTFVQMYFVFRNSKLCIHANRIVARFGLMHMVATNLCVWFRVITMETIHELHDYIQHGDSGGHHDNVVDHQADGTDRPTLVRDDRGSNATHRRQPVGSEQNDVMSQTVAFATPYLYACTIEYSLICAGVVYLIWRNIGRPVVEGHHQPSQLGADHPQYRPPEIERFTTHLSFNCAKSSKGLFCGIVLLMATIISMVVFFTLFGRSDVHMTSFPVMYLTKLVLCALSVLAVGCAANGLRVLRFNKDLDNSLDEVLLLVTMIGVYMFGMFSALCGLYRNDSFLGVLVIITSLLSMFQTTIQTLFILNGLRRSATSTGDQQTRMPGREHVIFLVISNAALWAVNSFQVLRSESNPVAIEFYGQLPWSLITHVSVPLAIFYRFHSTVCLVDIWKEAYKVKEQ